MTRLDLVHYENADAFLIGAGDFLAAREAEHNLLLGLAGRLRTSPRMYGYDPYLAAVTRGGKTVAVALRTPPHNVILSAVADAEAVDVLAAHLAEVSPDLPGVLGPKEASRRFVEAWRRATGRSSEIAAAERIFRCGRVQQPASTPGALRRATASDRPLLIEWTEAFAVEAMRGHIVRSAEEAADEYLSRTGDYGVYLWDDDRPVSLVACGSPTPTGARIGPVYTPPPLRGRGYASAATAAVTQLLLDAGRRFCFLFTDLANPTSNKIYQHIGYEPVTDVDEYRFES